MRVLRLAVRIIFTMGLFLSLAFVQTLEELIKNDGFSIQSPLAVEAVSAETKLLGIQVTARQAASPSLRRDGRCGWISVDFMQQSTASPIFYQYVTDKLFLST